MARNPQRFQDLAIRVAAGASIASAARALGLPERTARGYAATPEFKEIVRDIRADVLKRAAGLIGTVSVKAMAKVAKHIDSPDPDVSLRACKLALDAVPTWNDMADVDDRISALESRQGNGRKR